MKTLALTLLALATATAFAVDLGEATQPLQDGVPEVAVVRLRALLATELPNETKRAALSKLAEALLAAGQPAEALEVLRDPLLTKSDDFLRAQAEAALGRWEEALALYREVARTDLARSGDALFGEAEALRALGRLDEALPVLEGLMGNPRWAARARFNAMELLLARDDVATAQRLLNSTRANTTAERKVRRLLAGRIEWQARRSQRAIGMYASILKNPQGASHEVLMAALYALADAHIELGTPDSGDDYLEDFIEHHPTDAELPAVFAKLDQLYTAERRQSRHELGRWAREPAQPRRALAQWYLARAELRLGRREAAAAAYAQLAVEAPEIPALGRAYLDYAGLLLQDGKSAEAQTAVERARRLPLPAELRTRVEFVAARTDYARGRFAESASNFQRVAHHPNSAQTNDALVNASLAWLSAGEAAPAAAAAQELEKNGGDENARGTLVLEEGLVAAASGEEKAAETLKKFTTQFPKHPRVSEAWVALAELAFRAAPPRLEEARQEIARALENQPTAAALERADYLLIWLEEATKAGDEQVIERAKQFLQKHPGSPRAADVRLKLAETFYRRQDFANAQTQFELLTQQDPKAPLAEKAQFFAAESAMNSMGQASLERALVLFDEVVKRGGELKWAARNEQAIIERKLGKPQDALTLYDEVLKGDAKPEEKREALCGRGDVFYDLGATQPDNYQRAIEAYEQLAAQRDAPAHWRNQAIFKKGMCLEKLERRDEALATFYGVVESETRPDKRAEFFWFYKAGFNAARLLEEQTKWQAAAALYEKLAFAGGARSEEAKARFDRLRLEHFLWDE